jgi:hypothetical protein
MNGNGSKTPPLGNGRPGMPGQNNRYSLVVSDYVVWRDSKADYLY